MIRENTFTILYVFIEKNPHAFHTLVVIFEGFHDLTITWVVSVDYKIDIFCSV